MRIFNQWLKFKKKIKIGEKHHRTIAIAGNPNVGKSTIFNALTGMHQHTGNWPGKTVSNATGYFCSQKNHYTLIDIPGTYSLYPHSAEEEVAGDYLCFQNPDAVLVVCDATCIEKNLNLVLQIMEITKNIIVCINLIDEAQKKHIKINTQKISNLLGVKVIGITAHKKKNINELINFLDEFFENDKKTPNLTIYDKKTENELLKIEDELKKYEIYSRWVAIKILEGEEKFFKKIGEKYNVEFEEIKRLSELAKMSAKINGDDTNEISERIAKALISNSKKITRESVEYKFKCRNLKDRKIDAIMTGKFTAVPIMVLLVALIFWITISGANYLSEYLSRFAFYFEEKIAYGLNFLNFPKTITDAVVFGGYRVFAWVLSVMLPPMAIFFPFFTLLEDSGYLARIAYNLDRPFYSCNACGKQALTMCMGFGCNAVGVTGARIIDSPRERLLAITTNGFMPCNGRFPMLITIITIFFVGLSFESANVIFAALILSFCVLFAVLITFLITKILSKTILKGMPSSYLLELPSYRRPQIGKVITRSVFDRTLFVLGRAVIVAIPAGFVIWGLSNILIDEKSILSICSDFLQPIGGFLGMDGVILLSFILGTPANEIVIPILLMLYSSGNTLTEISDYTIINEILIKNGWNIKTAVCMIIFTIFHWPCATTIFTIKKETGDLRWTLCSIVLPTLIGSILCIIVNFLFKIFV